MRQAISVEQQIIDLFSQLQQRSGVLHGHSNVEEIRILPHSTGGLLGPVSAKW